jgi:hypothetical protein
MRYMEFLLKLSFLILSSLFTGIALFLSTVLRNTFNSLAEKDYYTVFSKIIRYGRRSLLINAIVLIPIAILAAYFALGFNDKVFIAGSILYISSSFAVSKFVNEPIYTGLLKTDSANYLEIHQTRSLLNKANILRAALSFVGMIIIAASFFLD